MKQCRARLLAGIHGAQGSTHERVWQRLTSLDACHFTRRSVYAATGPSARRLLAAMATWDVGGLQHDGTGLACGSSSRSDRRLPPPTEHRSYASMSPRKCRLRPGPARICSCDNGASGSSAGNAGGQGALGARPDQPQRRWPLAIHARRVARFTFARAFKASTGLALHEAEPRNTRNR